MPRDTDPFWKHVSPGPNKMWICNFCGNQYAGSATRIKAHLAGLGGYGIHPCKVVDGGLRSEAQKALKAKGPVEPSNGLEGNVQGSSYPHLISSSLTRGPTQPVTVSNEDAGRETSYTAVPNLSSVAMSTVVARPSAFLSLKETNVPSQSLPAQNMIPEQDFSFWTRPPQSQAGDSYIQPQSSSYPSGGGDLAPEALTNVPGPVNAEDEEGEPNAETPQGDALLDGRPSTCGLVHENMPNLKRKREELSNREADMDELEAWCRKAERIKGEYWRMVQAFREGRSLAPQQVERVDKFSKEVDDILGRCSFRKGSTTHAAGCRKSSPLVTTELAGIESEGRIKKICGYLMEDETFIIGIWGMGGVGKTAILMHVHNRILENPAFDDVFWITVPHEFGVYEVQEEIANVVGLDNLSKDKDVKRRACILNRHLKEKKRSVLLLDGLWMHFEVEAVGIPIEKGGLKLVLTTQSLDVCHKMFCQKQIKIEPLCVEEDYWSLFLKKLCFRKELPSEVKDIGRSILDKCGGLPLGIIEIATRMRGIEEVHEWKGMLRKLKDSRVELDVFKRLKLSYVNLSDSQVQQCFLHLVLCFGEYVENDATEEDLIESFVDEGLLSGKATRQELHDEGKTILGKIKKACLGVTIVGWRLFVHPLIRDMALQIVTSTAHMAKAKMGLKEIPEEELWTDRLEKVFLQGNNIKEIPHGISPNCPKLRRLSLNDNVSLEAIHESFFRHLNGLKVLDLSNTRITKLPDLVTQLESLEALLLRGCEELQCIPCVGKLGSLRKLDLNGCAMIEEVPEGMESLVKLTYLDLSATKIGTFPEGVLDKLVKLQYLSIRKARAREWSIKAEAEKIECSVSSVETFNACVRIIERNSCRKYKLGLNVSEEDFTDDYKDYVWGKDKKKIIIGSCHSIAAWEDGGIAGDGSALLIPKNVRVLKVGGCGGVRGLGEVGPLENLEELVIKEWENLEEVGRSVNFPRLERLSITGCPKLKHLFKWEWLATAAASASLPNLEKIVIKDCEELEEIIGGGVNFPRLKRLSITGCPKLKHLLKWEWLTTTSASLPKLEKIEIEDCEELEEIIGGGPVRNPIGIGGAPTYLIRELMIKGCNKMKGVLLTQDMLLHLASLEKIKVEDCKGVEVIIGGTVANTTTHSSFPHLERLTLGNLPELKSICDDGGTLTAIPSGALTYGDVRS